MKRGWIWAVLLVALLVISACRSVEDEAGHNGSEAAATEDLGLCQPEDETCVDESALSETPEEEETAPTKEPEPEETVEEAPTEEPADANTEVSESAPVVENPFLVRETDWVMGPDDAFITLIEYGDYQ